MNPDTEELLLIAAEHLLRAAEALVSYMRDQAGVEAPRLAYGETGTFDQFFQALPLPAPGDDEKDIAAKRMEVIRRINSTIDVDHYLENLRREYRIPQLVELSEIQVALHKILYGLSASDRE